MAGRKPRYGRRSPGPAPARGGPASLPAGVRGGAQAGEYVHVKTGIVLVWVPAGHFEMGGADDEARAHEKPVRTVTFTKGFFLAKFPVTWGQWKRWGQCADWCKDNKKPAPERPGFAVDDQHPVVNVTWEVASAYCGWAVGLRLPSEAEWEYACRAGSTTKFCFGDEEAQLEKYAWYAANAGGATHPVGQRLANAWGLHDMHGNVWEWCQDWFQSSYAGAPPDGSAWLAAGSSSRVYRGGGWGRAARYCRSACRVWNVPGFRNPFLGFRPAMAV